MERVTEMVAGHAHLWRDKGDDYWLPRLMQEVGELGSSLIGDHADPPEHELRQIASIAINWLDHRASRPSPAERDREDVLSNGDRISLTHDGSCITRRSPDGMSEVTASDAFVFVLNPTDTGRDFEKVRDMAARRRERPS